MYFERSLVYLQLHRRVGLDSRFVRHASCHLGLLLGVRFHFEIFDSTKHYRMHAYIKDLPPLVWTTFLVLLQNRFLHKVAITELAVKVTTTG